MPSALTWAVTTPLNADQVYRQPIGRPARAGMSQSAMRDPKPAVSPAMIDSPEVFWFIPRSFCRAGRDAFEGAPDGFRQPIWSALAGLLCSPRATP